MSLQRLWTRKKSLELVDCIDSVKDCAARCCPIITNIVISGRLCDASSGEQISFTKEKILDFHLYSRVCTQYKPRRFPGLIATVRRSKRKQHPRNGIEDNLKVTLFKSGAVVLSGVRNPRVAQKRAVQTLRMLTDANNAEIEQLNMQNLVGRFQLCTAETNDQKHFTITQCENSPLAGAFEITYTPELSPAVICRRRGNRSIVVQLHHTGQAIVSGCRSVDEFLGTILLFIQLYFD